MKFLIVNPDTNGQSLDVIYTDIQTGIASPAVSVAPGQDVTVDAVPSTSITIMLGVAHITPDTPEPLVPSAPVVSGDPIPEAAQAPQTVDQADPANNAVPTAVVSTDPAHGATADSPVILTQDDSGAIQATPILPDPDLGSAVVPAPGTVTVAADGTPSVATVDSSQPTPSLGDTAPAPEGTPALADVAASDAGTAVGAPVEAPAPADAGSQDQPAAQADTAPLVTADAVISEDPAHGAPTDGQAIVTQAQDGTVVSTPVVGGTVDPGTVTVAPDGSPTAPGATLGAPATAPDGTPAPADLVSTGVADPVGAPQAVDGTTPEATTLGDATGSTPISDDHAEAAASAPEATNATVVALIQALEENDAALTEQGVISIPHLNAALVAGGFAPITVDHPALAG